MCKKNNMNKTMADVIPKKAVADSKFSDGIDFMLSPCILNKIASNVIRIINPHA